MPERREKDGIIYFEEPYEVKYTSWLSSHLDCDSILVKNNASCGTITVLCYASEKQFNQRLKAVRDSEYPDGVLMRGIGHGEVNSID